jgi:SP family arabinose:H+ symporter-like MFS transporter
MKDRNKQFYILWLSFVGSLGGFLFGYYTAVISGTLGFVRSQFELNAILEGWYVSSALVGCIAGVAGAGWLSDKYGRKNILILASVLLSISAIGCTISPSFSALVIFRLIGGIGVGIASMLSPMYISEISPTNMRGRLVSLYQFAITIGILCSFFINAYLLNSSGRPGFSNFENIQFIFKEELWRAMLGMTAIPALAFFFLLLTIPESPRWLMVKGRFEKAQKSLIKILGSEAASAEIKEIEETLEMGKVSWRISLSPGIKRAVYLGSSLAILAVFTGIDAIIYYGPKILEEAGFGLSDALGGQVIIGFINMIFTLVAIWKIDKIGRRPLLIAGTSGMLLSLTAIGLLFVLHMAEGYLLISFLLIFIACFSFSLGPVVWVILSEIYPTKIRGRAMSVATLVTWIGTAIIGQLIPVSLTTIGPAFTFWVFAVFCFPTIYLGWKILPETKGRTLEEIERYWLKYSK